MIYTVGFLPMRAPNVSIAHLVQPRSVYMYMWAANHRAFMASNYIFWKCSFRWCTKWLGRYKVVSDCLSASGTGSLPKVSVDWNRDSWGSHFPWTNGPLRHFVRFCRPSVETCYWSSHSNLAQCQREQPLVRDDFWNAQAGQYISNDGWFKTFGNQGASLLCQYYKTQVGWVFKWFGLWEKNFLGFIWLKVY